MNEITYQKSYQEYKEELKTELNRTVESFVRIGYLLKVARDTDILKQSEYDNVVDFAKAEYGIDKTQVSRFIHINDKFSEGGYADHLLPEYQGYGYAKLTIMLQLPDAINEALSPEYTKSEIQQIKNEIDEEKKISDLEVMMETRKVPGGRLIKRVIEKIGEDDPELFVEIAKVIKQEGKEILPFTEIATEMAPDDEKTYSVRVPAEGRIMLMLSKNSCRMVNTRSGERTDTDWQEIKEEWVNLIKDLENPEDCWSETYCQPFPKEEKEPVAPVQPKKESKVQVKKPQKPINTEREREKEATAPAVEETETKREEETPEKPINTLCEAEKEEQEEDQPTAVNEEPEKVTGEVVENVDFTECESAKEKRIQMIKKVIMKDIAKLNEQTFLEQWAGATLTVTDIELQLRQVKALLTEEEENGSVSNT